MRMPYEDEDVRYTTNNLKPKFSKNENGYKIPMSYIKSDEYKNIRIDENKQIFGASEYSINSEKHANIKNIDKKHVYEVPEYLKESEELENKANQNKTKNDTEFANMIRDAKISYDKMLIEKTKKNMSVENREHAKKEILMMRYEAEQKFNESPDITGYKIYLETISKLNYIKSLEQTIDHYKQKALMQFHAGKLQNDLLQIAIDFKYRKDNEYILEMENVLEKVRKAEINYISQLKESKYLENNNVGEPLLTSKEIIPNFQKNLDISYKLHKNDDVSVSKEHDTSQDAIAAPKKKRSMKPSEKSMMESVCSLYG